MISNFISETWILIGIIFIILEFIIFSSINFLFLALGAFCVAILVNSYKLSYINQFIIACFLSLTYAIGTFFFYRRVYLKKHKKDSYKDILGKEVVVHSDSLNQEFVGQVLWSSTLWNAKMCENESAQKGDRVFIIRIEGNVLYCSKNTIKLSQDRTEKE